MEQTQDKARSDRPRESNPARDDLDDNPGIGQSGGSWATGEDPNEIAGENTVEGDVENDPQPSGAASERHLGRTNE